MSAVHAGLWGLLAAAGLLIGAVVAVVFYERLSHRTIAATMGFGSGVLIALLSLDLMREAHEHGGVAGVMVGSLLGAVSFSATNWWLARRGAKHRNRCGGRECVPQPREEEQAGSGMAIAAGALLDSIPESLVIGLALSHGGQISGALVTGFFLANLPQGLSSASGMKTAGRSTRYIFGVWLAIVLLSGVAAAAGYLVLGSASPVFSAGISAFAAGAVLAMLAEAMIPEAFEKAQPFIGVATLVGFLAAFFLIQR